MGKLQEQQIVIAKSNKMEDFINKIQELYNSLYDIKDNSKAKVKVLWRWIKSVIKHIGKDKSFDVVRKGFNFRISKLIRKYVIPSSAIISLRMLMH